MSYPTPGKSEQDIPKWVNPCRIPVNVPTVVDESIVIEEQKDSEIFSNIMFQARKAESQAKRFMTKYVSNKSA